MVLWDRPGTERRMLDHLESWIRRDDFKVKAVLCFFTFYLIQYHITEFLNIVLIIFFLSE